jgi:hypothetical protein
MRHPMFLALLLASSSCFAQTQSSEPSSFLTALQNMPSQIRSGTFDQEAFKASQGKAEADPSLDVAAACRLLKTDLVDSNSKVSIEAAIVISGLVRQKSNSDADRKILASTLLSCVDESNNPNSQQLCVTFLVDYGMPVSAMVQFKDLAARKIVDGTAFPWLAVGLSLVASRWPNVNADSVLAEFFRSSSVLDTVKAKAIFSLQNMPLSDAVLDAVAELLSKTKSDELKLQIIQVSQKSGERALEREHNTLLLLEANLSESQQVRQAAGSALRPTPQGNAAVPGIH